MSNKFIFKSRLTIILHDIVMVLCAWFFSFWFSFRLQIIPVDFQAMALVCLPFVVISQSGIFWYFGLYQGVWRFSSLPDLICIFKSVIVGALFISGSLFLYNRLLMVPRSIFPLYICFLLLFLSLPRLFYRHYKDYVKHERSAKRALIVGAGAAADMLARDLLQDEHAFLPVAFVDDDKNKKSRSIRGLMVLFDTQLMQEHVEKNNIDIILIAIPSASVDEMKRIVEVCEKTNIPFKTLPSVKDLLSPLVSKKNLRDVAITDILGREVVGLNWEELRKSLFGKRILITGGGGSIGAELCMQLARIEPELLVIYDHSEFNLYQINASLQRYFPELKHKAVLGSVTDRAHLKSVMACDQPSVVFHAAAYKHVPLLEGQALVAVNNNIVGTKNVAELALEAKVERFVLISTDKAVNPTNVMGATKRVAEILCQNLGAQSKQTSFITVRFGNVLDSAGSVVPLFRAQIKEGGPITVTHPEVTRFFMTIPEACRLIMKAATVGVGGEIYVLDMGAAIKISYLAEQMIKLSGLEVGSDIKIKYVGLRAGEKLHEELFHEQEQLLGTGYEKLFLAQVRSYEKVAWDRNMLDLLAANDARDVDEVIAYLKVLVPEFVSMPLQYKA